MQTKNSQNVPNHPNVEPKTGSIATEIFQATTQIHENLSLASNAIAKILAAHKEGE